MIEYGLTQGYPKAEVLQTEIYWRIQVANKHAAELVSKRKESIALKLLIKAKTLLRRVYDKQKRTTLKSLICNSIACVYRETKNIELAEYYVEKALALNKLSQTHENLGTIYINAAVIFSLVTKYTQAKLYVKDGIKIIIAELKQAQHESDIKNTNEKESLLAFSYLILGEQNVKLGHIKTAYKCLMKAKQLAENNSETSANIKKRILYEIAKIKNSIPNSRQKSPLNKRVRKRENSNVNYTRYSQSSARKIAGL